MKAFISFCGFYNSEIAPDIRIESIRDSQSVDLPLYNDFTDDEVTAYITDCIGAFDFDVYKAKVGACYCKHYETMLQNLDDSLADVKVNFSRIVSPKEYNFYTDCCEVEISEADILKIRAYADTVLLSDEMTFAEYISERMHPCDGYIPFYSENVDDWGYVCSWSCAQLRCLFDFVLNTDSVVCDEYGFVNEQLRDECEEALTDYDPDPDEWLKEYRADNQ